MKLDLEAGLTPEAVKEVLEAVDREEKEAQEQLKNLNAKGPEAEQLRAEVEALQETEKTLGKGNLEEIRVLLFEGLDAKRKWDILKIENAEEREKARLDYAKEERQSFLDFGGGHGGSTHWYNLWGLINFSQGRYYNWSGTVNNFQHAKEELKDLSKNAQTETIKAEASTLVTEMGHGTAHNTENGLLALLGKLPLMDDKHLRDEAEARLFGRYLEYWSMWFWGRGPLYSTRMRVPKLLFGKKRVEKIMKTTETASRYVRKKTWVGRKYLIAKRWWRTRITHRINRYVKRPVKKYIVEGRVGKWFSSLYQKIPGVKRYEKFKAETPGGMDKGWKHMDGFVMYLMTNQLLDPDPYFLMTSYNKNANRTPWPDPKELYAHEKSKLKNQYKVDVK